jgi:hypothetical protein
MTTSSANGSAKADQDIRTSDAPILGTSWLHMLGQWNMEITSLYGKRLQECCVFPFSLMLCTSPDDVTDAQVKFSDMLLADYRAAAEKLAGSFDASKVRGKEATEAYAAALLKAQDDARNILDQARAHAKHIIEDAQARIVEPKTAKEHVKAA